MTPRNPFRDNSLSFLLFLTSLCTFGPKHNSWHLTTEQNPTLQSEKCLNAPVHHEPKRVHTHTRTHNIYIYIYIYIFIYIWWRFINPNTIMSLEKRRWYMYNLQSTPILDLCDTVPWLFWAEQRYTSVDRQSRWPNTVVSSGAWTLSRSSLVPSLVRVTIGSGDP